jgi:uncharacterized protein GlcG (DUF336 family)
MKPTLSHKTVRDMIEHTILKADELGIAVNIAVVDDGGNLAGFIRMDRAALMAGEIAQNKAYTAVGFGIPTSAWYPRMKDKPSLANGIVHTPRMVILGGGLPIYIDGELVGGIGVSGGTEAQDEMCALAGLKWLEQNE